MKEYWSLIARDIKATDEPRTSRKAKSTSGAHSRSKWLGLAYQTKSNLLDLREEHVHVLGLLSISFMMSSEARCSVDSVSARLTYS